MSHRKSTPIDIQSVVDAQDAPAVIIDKDYRIVAANRQYCESYGVRPDDIIGCRCHEVSHRSPVPCHENGEQCPHREVFQNGIPFEVLHTHFDRRGNPDHVRIKAYPLKDVNDQTCLMEAIFRLAPSLDINCDDMRMVGRSKAFLRCVEELSIAARSDAHILIDGESGVGKDLAARFLHEQSGRQNHPYVELSCAAITESLCEDELFGHERGAFTGCIGTKQGLFELADGGTLFLDEIGEMPLSIQARLLRVLDAGEFRRVGGEEKRKADIRVVAATNRNLLDMVKEGRFRKDLYFRIAAIRITVPPLRERQEDIAPLAEILIKRLCRNADRPCRITQPALDKLLAYDFPGNIRELKNILQKAMAMSANGVIEADHIDLPDAVPSDPLPPEAAVPSLSGKPESEDGIPLSIAEMESLHIASLLKQYQGNRRRVARALNISERTLYRKIKRYALQEVARTSRNTPKPPTQGLEYEV